MPTAKSTKSPFTRYGRALALIDGRWRRVTIITRVRRETATNSAKWCVEDRVGGRHTRYELDMRVAAS